MNGVHLPNGAHLPNGVPTFDIPVDDGGIIITTVTRDANAITEWIQDVNNAAGNNTSRLVGFEVQFASDTMRIGTVQLCIGNRCLIFQLSGDGSPCPPSLDQFLDDPNNILLGTDLEAKWDLLREQLPLHALLRQWCDLTETSVWVSDAKRIMFASSGSEIAIILISIALENIFLKVELRAEVVANANVYIIVYGVDSVVATVTKHPTTVTTWINGLNNARKNLLRYIGFEVEFHYGTSQIGTVQLCVGNRCLIFQISNNRPCPPFLEHFLCDHHTIIVGSNLRSKLKLLRKQLPFTAEIWNMLDWSKSAVYLKETKQSVFASLHFGNVHSDFAREQALSPEQNFLASVNLVDTSSSETVAISDLASQSEPPSSEITSHKHVAVNEMNTKIPEVDSLKKIKSIEAEVVIKHLKEARIKVMISNDLGPSKKLLEALINIIIEDIHGGLYEESDWLDKLLSGKSNLVILSFGMAIIVLLMLRFLSLSSLRFLAKQHQLDMLLLID
ncbi:hypothetical protein ACS0TY_000334 [Phlomoides rotata]